MSTGSRQGWGWSLCHNHLCTSKSSSAFLERVLSPKVLDHVLKGVAWSCSDLSVLMSTGFNSRCILSSRSLESVLPYWGQHSRPALWS